MDIRKRSPDTLNIDALQMLRALAALLVVVWHSGLAIKNTSAHYWLEGDAAFRAAHYPSFMNHLDMGVDIFFCISGFIMMMLVHKESPGQKAALSFFMKRAIRIAPPYWFFTILIVGVFFASDGKFNVGQLSADWNANLSHFWRSVLLIPQAQAPILGVGWTLIHEFQFYLLCTLSIMFGLNHRLLLILATLSVLSIALTLLGVVIFHGYGFSTYYIEFLFGALGFRWAKYVTRYAPLTQLAFALLIYLILSSMLDMANLRHAAPFLRPIGGAMIGFLLINGLIGADERYSLSNTLTGKYLMRLGDASYTLYLGHWFVLSLMGKIVGLTPHIPIALVIVWQLASITMAIMVSVVLSERIELPLHRSLVRKHLSWSVGKSLSQN
jgi:exopolysaccharide production protein ExoZ